MLVSTVRQGKSAIHIRISPLSWISFPIYVTTESWVGILVLHSRFSLVIYFIHNINCVEVKVLVIQPCLTLWDPRDCSPPGSSVHVILQARILEWVAISFSRLSSRPSDWSWVSHIAGRFFTIWATREALVYICQSQSPSKLVLKFK